jgi:hypothetical protein
VRPLMGSTEPTICMSLTCGVPMEYGDHSACSVELIACPEHRDDQMRAMGYEPGQAVASPQTPHPARTHQPIRWTHHPV